jgi:hypothetical protein
MHSNHTIAAKKQAINRLNKDLTMLRAQSLQQQDLVQALKDKQIQARIANEKMRARVLKTLKHLNGSSRMMKKEINTLPIGRPAPIINGVDLRKILELPDTDERSRALVD